MLGFSTAMTGWWLASTVISPSAEERITASTSPATRIRSGVTSSKGKSAVIDQAFRVRLLCFGREFLGLLDGLLDGPHHVEGRLGQVVVLALDESLGALDRVLEIDELSRRAGKHLRD